MEKIHHGMVSVIVPVYNVGDYIEESMKSLVEQVYNNIEVILVDDGSQDDSVTIAEKILYEANISYQIIRQENRGLPSARNTGTKKANGEYICFVDSDDIIDSIHVELLVDALQQNGVDFAFSDYECTSLKNRKGTAHTEKSESSERLINTKELRKNFLRRKIQILCCAMMFRRSYIIDNSLWFDERLRFGEDVEFLWRILSSIKEGAIHVELDTYKYLSRPGSLMTAQKIDRIKTFIEVFDESSHNLMMSETAQDILFARVVLGVFHSFAKYGSFISFYGMRHEIREMNVSQKFKKIKGLGDLRWTIMEKMFHYCPIGFYVVSKVV